MLPCHCLAAFCSLATLRSGLDGLVGLLPHTKARKWWPITIHVGQCMSTWCHLHSFTILTLVIDTWYISIHDPNPFQTFSNRQQYDGSHVINHGFLVATTWVTNWDWSVCTPPVPPLRWHRKWPEENWTGDLGILNLNCFGHFWVGFPILVRLPFWRWLIGCKNCLGGWKQVHFLGGKVSVDWLKCLWSNTNTSCLRINAHARSRQLFWYSCSTESEYLTPTMCEKHGNHVKTSYIVV